MGWRTRPSEVLTRAAFCRMACAFEGFRSQGRPWLKRSVSWKWSSCWLVGSVGFFWLPTREAVGSFKKKRAGGSFLYNDMSQMELVLFDHLTDFLSVIIWYPWGWRFTNTLCPPNKHMLLGYTPVLMDCYQSTIIISVSWRFLIPWQKDVEVGIAPLSKHVPSREKKTHNMSQGDEIFQLGVVIQECQFFLKTVCMCQLWENSRGQKFFPISARIEVAHFDRLASKIAATWSPFWKVSWKKPATGRWSHWSSLSWTIIQNTNCLHHFLPKEPFFRHEGLWLLLDVNGCQWPVHFRLEESWNAAPWWVQLRQNHIILPYSKKTSYTLILVKPGWWAKKCCGLDIYAYEKCRWCTRSM